MSANAQRVEQAPSAAFDIAPATAVQGNAIADRFSRFRVRPESHMPWDSGLSEDGLFKKALFHGLGILVVLILIVSFMPDRAADNVAKTVKREQYAQLVIETKEVPPPPPVPEVKKPEPKKEKPKPVEPEKPKVKKKEKPEPKKQPVKQVKKKEPPKPTEAELRQKAREKAANSGLMAFADDLSSLRQKADASSVTSLNAGGGEAKQIKRNLIAAKTSGKISGGAAISQQSAAAGLAGAGQAEVVVSQAVVDAVAVDLATERSGNRSAEEVRRVMDANKGAIYSVYNRALRKNPALEGTFSFTMTIDPSGSITNVELVSSELADPTLEKRLLARIRMIRFDAAEVGETQVNYSFDFLPY